MWVCYPGNILLHGYFIFLFALLVCAYFFSVYVLKSSGLRLHSCLGPNQSFLEQTIWQAHRRISKEYQAKTLIKGQTRWDRHSSRQTDRQTRTGFDPRSVSSCVCPLSLPSTQIISRTRHKLMICPLHPGSITHPHDCHLLSQCEESTPVSGWNIATLAVPAALSKTMLCWKNGSRRRRVNRAILLF